VDRLLGLLDRGIRALLVLVVAVMVAVVFAQVVARYGLNASIGWADEIARLAFVTTVFLGIAVAVRARAHIGIELAAAVLPAAAARPLRRLVLAGSAALAAIVAWEGAMIAAEQWDERMISVELSSGWFLVPVVAGMAVSALHLASAALLGERQGA
jgi:TRAP-type C4-dicarboxylate transport system permease small subunit